MINIEQVYQTIAQHVPAWSQGVTADDLVMNRLNGNSNECYRVAIKEEKADKLANDVPKTLLYRKYV